MRLLIAHSACAAGAPVESLFTLYESVPDAIESTGTEASATAPEVETPDEVPPCLQRTAAAAAHETAVEDAVAVAVHRGSQGDNHTHSDPRSFQPGRTRLGVTGDYNEKLQPQVFRRTSRNVLTLFKPLSYR